MFVTTPDAFLEACERLTPQPGMPATARAAFLVAPAEFQLAQESARDNHYMDLDAVPDPQRALAQHAELAGALRRDVPVITFPGDQACPDGLFPNNVFATRRGRLIVGRMRHPVRQRETTRSDIRGFFRDLLGYEIIELGDGVAELTGALVIDHARGIGYCGLSERCDEAGARAMHEAFGLRLTFCFRLAPGEYHANVIMATLAGRGVLLCESGFADAAAAHAIARVYGGHALWFTPQQKAAFTLNAITLGHERVWISQRGAAALTSSQCAALNDWGFDIASVDLSEIEKGGGSLRCCVAEIF